MVAGGAVQANRGGRGPGCLEGYDRAMERVAVTSSAIRSVGYDAGSKTLEIEFASGDVYQYSGVPVEAHAGLMAAESKGTYFATSIRNAGYAYSKVR